MSEILVIKRNKSIESFDVNKLASSIENTCLSLDMPSAIAVDTARMICGRVDIWLRNKHEVTSRDLRVEASRAFCEINQEAGHFYKNYRDTL